MKQRSAIALQTAIALLGIAVLVFLLWEPTIEGRNAHATLFEVYFNDPFLAWAYIAAAPFFMALYQAFRLFGEARRSGAFSPRSLSALRTIRYCMVTVLGFIAVGEAYLFIVVKGEDDIAGGIAMGVLVGLFLTFIATAAALFERRLQRRIWPGAVGY